ncbi:MAG: hypothetical protein ACI9TH_003443 [Kiritimatiellia bacterium]|jgi:hypothetical protein
MKPIVSLTLFIALSSLGWAETKAVKAGDLSLNIPSTWTQEETTSNMRLAQFVVPGAAEGEQADLVIYYFGAASGGGVKANIDRWVGQFAEAGRASKETKGTSANGPFDLVSVTGTYNKPVGPPIMRKTAPTPGQQMLAAIVQTDNGNYFLKFTGPEKTLKIREKEFLDSFGAK